jgi:hypothetical protein
MNNAMYWIDRVDEVELFSLYRKIGRVKFVTLLGCNG